MTISLLIQNIGQLITCNSPGQPKRGDAMVDVGIIEDAAVAIDNGIIVDVGQSKQLHVKYSAHHEIDAGGNAVCPGFVDPHTHVVYAGDRVNEFEMRIKGATYMEIMAAGGGIVSSTKAISAMTVEQLAEESRPRLDMMLELGTTTAEIKSGYGLDTVNELKMLQAMDVLEQTHVIDIIPTFLGAHAVPLKYKGRTDAYVDLVIDDMLPKAAQWFKSSAFFERNTPFFVDVFCENNAFDLEQSQKVLKAGADLGMKIKAHVDEFTALGAVTMAVGLGAVSVDHLDVTGKDEIAVLAESDTVGVVIPAVNFNLGSADFANARAMIDAGAIIALCTDINPGSAPCPSMQLVMAIACRYQHLLPTEALNAATINAAYAIGMGDSIGSIEKGKQADLLILNTHDYRHLAYQFGGNLVKTVIKHGQIT
jgi:imidazolonepropionase